MLLGENLQVSLTLRAWELKKLFFESLAETILPLPAVAGGGAALSLSTIVSVAVCGVPSVAPELGLVSESETVSLLSTTLSFVIGMETVFEVWPAAKETVCETAV